jgi:hypothetical protein
MGWPPSNLNILHGFHSCHFPNRRTLFYLTIHITLHSDHFTGWRRIQCSPLLKSAAGQVTRALVQCNAVDVSLLITACKGDRKFDNTHRP